MTDAQLGLLIAAIASFGGLIVGALKWSVGRITKAIDDNTAARDKESESRLELAKAMTGLSVKIDAVADFVHDHTPVGGTEQPPELRVVPAPRTRTPVGGVRIVERRRTQADEDR